MYIQATSELYQRKDNGGEIKTLKGEHLREIVQGCTTTIEEEGIIDIKAIGEEKWETIIKWKELNTFPWKNGDFNRGTSNKIEDFREWARREKWSGGSF